MDAQTKGGLIVLTSADHLKIQQRVKGVDVTLTRGAIVVRSRAVRGMTKGQVIGADGTFTKFITTDFLMTAEQTGAIGKPEAGDVITSGGQSFTVAYPDPKQPPVAWFGQDATAYRIHTIED